MEPIIDKLLKSSQPAIRYKTLVNVLSEPPNSPKAAKLSQEVKKSGLVQGLLQERTPDGTIPYHPYAKWYGSHWVFSILADIGYAKGDKSLVPMREQILEWLFSDHHWKSIKVINGLTRRCCSQEGNAVYSITALGLADERIDELAKRMVSWQWPDGGWNCAMDIKAKHSSFHESLIPLRALITHFKATGSKDSKSAADRAKEIFLKRRLFKSQTTGKVIHPSFARTHYPCYWHYDFLYGLKVMAEGGYIMDERCQDALDLLESKRLKDGGFPAEHKWYKVIGPEKTDRKSDNSLFGYGPGGKTQMNEFATVDALFVLKESGRIKI